MIIQAWWLLRKLKKAQIHLDGFVGIDEDTLKAVTIHDISMAAKAVSIKRYKYSLESTLEYLEGQKFIERNDSGIIRVTYIGWHILSATAAEATKLVLLNVVLPIVVSVIAAIITTISLAGS